MLPSLKDIEVDRIHGPANDNDAREKRKVSVDMNPMVDLAFLLLTFFMLATTFIKPQAMELLVPAKPKQEDVEKETPVKESKTLNLVLLESKMAWYRGISDPDPVMISFDEEKMAELVKKAMAETEGLVVLIKPLDESTYEHLVQVLDVMAVAGIDRYALDRPSEFDKTLSESEK
jgi:biopolymer transport protein ExbD